jgi:SAM-dependent methyltransferase
MKMSSIRFKHCPCCNSSDFTIWWDNQTLESLKDWKDFFYGGRKFIKDIISCCSCGYRFINAISPDSERWYSDQDIDVYRSMGVFRKRYFEEVKSGIINKFNPVFPADAAALDLACGDGLWLRLWRDRMRLFGTEACDNFNEVLSGEKITILTEKELQHKQYDLVSMFDFLEHIEEPDSFLIHKWGLLKPGGFLIIGVPDMGKIAALILGTIYYLVCPMHYSYFDCYSLDKLLKKTCPDANIAIYPSPSLKTDLRGMLKWVGIKCYIPNAVNFRLPIGYAASIIAVVKKQTSEA